MSTLKFSRTGLVLLLLFLASCGTLAPRPPAIQSAIATATAAAAVAAPGGAVVRACDFIPGKSHPAQMPADVLAGPPPTPAPTPYSFANSKVDPALTAAQAKLAQQIWDDVNKYYAYRDFHAKDWKAAGQKYQSLIQKGLDQQAFYQAMKQMLFELDGGETLYFTPAELGQESAAAATSQNLVGIGGVLMYVPVGGETRYVLSAVYPGSPAEKAGLKRHDLLLKVDGGPVAAGGGMPRTLGPEGSRVTVTVQTPGQPPRDLTLTRARVNVNAQMPVDACLVQGQGRGPRIGYLAWPDYQDPLLLARVTQALRKLSAGGPLQGLIIDTRGGPEGDDRIMRGVLGLFLPKGELGGFVSPGGGDTLSITDPQDVAGSQAVPLVLLQDGTSGHMNLIFNGLLQAHSRARIVGSPNHSATVIDKTIDYSDGSRLMVPNYVFQPKGQPPGYFDQQGVQPDVPVPSRWDLYNEATDPLLAKAVEMMMEK